MKIQNNCVQNKIIKIILSNLFYILTFFFWVNQWGANTDSLPYILVQAAWVKNKRNGSSMK